MNVDTTLTKSFAPGGRLRAAINLGNPILAGRDAATGAAKGVSVDLAMRLGQVLGVPVDLVVVDAAGKSVQAVEQDEADVGFFAVDPVRAQQLAFTAAYVLIEGCYLVRDDSPLRDNADVDRDGHVVVVGKGSAYDLFLTRELKHARIERSPTSPAVVDTFVDLKADVAAGVKQQLQADGRRLGGLRLLDGRFMVIQQAMGIAQRRGPEAASFLSAFVEEAKRAGFVADALHRHGIEGASVAPPRGAT